MTKKTWYSAFSEQGNTIFTEKDFMDYKNIVIKELKHYKKYLRPSSKILDVGCGLGCTVIPLSALGYSMVGIDNDPKVVEAAKQNAKSFGKQIKIIEGDIFELNKFFKKDSFDSCIIGGVLEHFNKKKIRKLVKLQLNIAPLVIASMPVKTRRTMKHFGVTEKNSLDIVFPDGIYRNLWSEEEWISNILNCFTIIEHFTGNTYPKIGNFDEVFIIIKRNKI